MSVSEIGAATGALEIPVQLAEARSLRWKSRVAGMIRAGDVYGRYTIPQRDHRRRSGYQRELSTARVNRLVKELREDRVDLPTSILVNLRTFDEDKNLVGRGNGLRLRLEDGQELHVVDGQHRVAALAKLVEEDPARWSDFEIAFVCMLGGNELEEMREFYVVNSTAKSVRTDLALDLLKQQAEADPVVSDSLLESGQSWKVEGQTLAEELNRTSLWRGLIRFPGEPKGVTTISSASMVSSLKPLLSNPYFSQITTPNQLKVLDAYWRGIQMVIPDPFAEPGEHALQKGLGAMVMHGFLVSVLEHIRAIGRSVIEPQPYADILADVLTDLEGDTTEGDVARGADFWRAGGEGAAGSYSSSAGRRVLTAKLRAGLPPIEVV
jgi:DGQHR domain-containing protein